MPPSTRNNTGGDDNAADLIRQKVAQIYSEEPDATGELTEARQAIQRSKHQQFMYELSTSGKDLATVQTEWHNYYQSLSPEEKHQVWQEFYSSQSLITGQPSATPEMPQSHALAQHKHEAARPHKLRQTRSKKQLQNAIRHKVSAGGKLEAKHHIQSLLFGLGMGLIVLIIFLFSFFNEIIIAPLIQPGRTSTSTPIILSSDTVAPTATPEVIIPKINVEIPVDYSQTSIDENVIEGALNSGIVHYPTTVRPGQAGNAAFFGHSSNNIFNKGKYKFAFVLLHTLVEGDTFYLTYEGKVYVYKVVSRQIVDPSNVSVLGPVAGQAATVTLITCDPPGTSLHRLIVVGQQISPDPAGNTQSETPAAIASTSPDSLPGNGPTLLGRVLRSTTGKVVAAGVIIAAIFLTVRWVNKPLRSVASDTPTGRA